MTIDDAVKMIYIMASADGGCCVCATKLMKEAVEAWPDMDWGTVLKEVRKRDKPWNDASENLESVLEERQVG